MNVSEIINWHASDKQYVDLCVYVTTDKLEYQFQVSLDLATGDISHSHLAGVEPHGAYEPIDSVPPIVLAAAAPSLAKMVAQLEALKEGATA